MTSCPTGQAVNGVNFKTEALNCVPVSSPASNSFRVVDNDGRLVGKLIGGGHVASLVNGEWFFLRVLTTGFPDRFVTFWYESVDCSGTGYVQDDTTTLPRSAGWLGSGASITLYTGAASRRVLRSLRAFHESNPNPTCNVMPDTQLDVALPTLVNVTATLPFRLTE